MRFLGNNNSRMSKKLMVAAISTSLLLASSITVAGATPIESNAVSNQFDISKLIPSRLAKSVNDYAQLKTAVTYGVLETVLRVIADKDSQWAYRI